MVVALEKDKAPFNFHPYSKLNGNAILKKWGYFPRMAIRWRAQGWTTFLLIWREDYKYELRYHSTLEEEVKARQEA